MLIPREDNMLMITTEGRKAALDLRLDAPAAPDDPDSKVNQAVENIQRIWREPRRSVQRQLVFCDLSTPKRTAGFSVYEDMRDKLVARGVLGRKSPLFRTTIATPPSMRLFGGARGQMSAFSSAARRRWARAPMCRSG